MINVDLLEDNRESWKAMLTIHGCQSTDVLRNIEQCLYRRLMNAIRKTVIYK